MMMLYSAFLCVFLVFCQNVLPVCCQSSAGRGPRVTNFENIEDLDSHVDTLHSSGQTRYSTPSTPRPENVDCYVEIPTTMRVGGTCVRYGQNTYVWLCQAGVNSQVNQNCRRRAENQHRIRGGHRRRSRNRRDAKP